jgi:hypothetical protein
MSSNNNTGFSSNKPFCKVCKDAGCSESQYTSHFVKDQPGPNGKVVCPTLLNQSCRICNQTGHTSSYCKQYKPRPSREEPRREEPRHQDYRREEPRDYRREEPRHQDYRRDDYRREEPRDYRREEPRDYRREEPRDYRRDDYRRDDYRRDDYRREEPRDYRREEPRQQDYRREEPRDYRREEPRHQEPRHQDCSREETQRRAPYAHPHGPRVRLQLEAPALSAASTKPQVFEMPPWGTPEYWRMFQTDDTASDSQPAKRVVIIDDEELSSLPVTQIDVRKVDLKEEPVWGDEPLVSMDAEHRRILEDEFMKCLISDEDFDLIVAADEDNMGGRRAIDNGD